MQIQPTSAPGVDLSGCDTVLIELAEAFLFATAAVFILKRRLRSTSESKRGNN